MADEKQKADRERYVDHLVDRLFTSMMQDNASGDIEKYVGRGYYGGDSRILDMAPKSIKEFLGNIRMGSRTSKTAGENALSPSAVSNLQDLQDLKMKKVNQFSESTFTDRQMDEVKKILIDPVEDSSQAVIKLVKAKLLLDATKNMESKYMRANKLDSPSMVPPPIKDRIKMQADSLIASPAFPKVLDYLSRKYSTPDPKTGKRPQVDQSDFSPYIWGAPELRKIYKLNGVDPNVFDRVDATDIPDSMLSPGLGPVEERRKAVAADKVKSLYEKLNGGQ